MVMVNSGLSFSNGLPRKPLASTGAAPGWSPPVQAGMLPSALPAFSPPSGVRLVPSLAASSGLTAAMTLVARRDSAITLDFRIVVVFMVPLSAIRRKCTSMRLTRRLQSTLVLNGHRYR
ncbi:hypothetical protein D3C81_1689830 [compost metagenome]